jgi:hypothetical protein
MRTENKIIITLIVLWVAGILFLFADQPSEFNRPGYITIYVHDNILFVYPNTLTIDKEVGKSLHFKSRMELNEFIEDYTAESVNMIPYSGDTTNSYK